MFDERLTGAPPCIFRTGQRTGVWFVTKDGAFYGDYLSRSQAIRSACLGALAVEARGGTAHVFASPGDVPIQHQIPAPRRALRESR